jgi:hypothetical protein
MFTTIAPQFPKVLCNLFQALKNYENSRSLSNIGTRCEVLETSFQILIEAVWGVQMFHFWNFSQNTLTGLRR